MLTAMEELDCAVRCIELGAEDYLTKPVNSVLLGTKMRSCLEKKRLRDQEVLHLRKMESYSGDLEKNVEARVKELKASNDKLELQIVERKLAERRLNQLSRQNELILNSAGDGIFGLDLDGNIAFVNPAAIRMLGSSREDLIGRPWQAIARHPHPKGSKDTEYQCHLTATDLQEQSIHSTCDVFRRVDGTSFPVEYVATAVIEDGDPKGAVVVFRDTTEQRKAAAQRDAELARAVRIQSGLLPETLPTLDGQSGRIHPLIGVEGLNNLQSVAAHVRQANPVSEQLRRCHFGRSEWKYTRRNGPFGEHASVKRDLPERQLSL
jgi:PAS domain S-box-containing protein